jgi:hypothetical protein
LYYEAQGAGLDILGVPRSVVIAVKVCFKPACAIGFFDSSKSCSSANSKNQPFNDAHLILDRSSAAGVGKYKVDCNYIR